MLFSVLEFKILITSLTKPSTTQFSKNIPVITKIQECSPKSRADEEFCCLRKTASLPGPAFSVIMPGEDTPRKLSWRKIAWRSAWCKTQSPWASWGAHRALAHWSWQLPSSQHIIKSHKETQPCLLAELCQNQAESPPGPVVSLILSHFICSWVSFLIINLPQGWHEWLHCTSQHDSRFPRHDILSPRMPLLRSVSTRVSGRPHFLIISDPRGFVIPFPPLSSSHCHISPWISQQPPNWSSRINCLPSKSAFTLEPEEYFQSTVWILFPSPQPLLSMFHRNFKIKCYYH